MKKVLLLFFISAFLSEITYAQNPISPRLRNILSEYHHVGPVAENGLIMVCKEDTEHCGCIDTMGNEVIPFIYGMNFFYFINENPQFNSVNRMVVAKPLTTIHAAYGIVDEKGKVILPFEYETDYHGFHPLNPYHIFKTYHADGSEKTQLYGVVDSLGNIVIPIIHKFIKKADNRNFIVRDNRRYGLINEKNDTLLPFTHENIEYNERYNLIFAKQNYKWTIYTLKGKQVTPYNYFSINFTNHGYLITQNDSITNFITPDGKVIKSFALDWTIKYDDPKSPIKFPLIIRQNKKFGVLNSSLEIIIPTEYDLLATERVGLKIHLSPNVYKVKKDGKEGFIDTSNKLLSTMWFDKIHWEGVVEKDSLFGWVNGQGELQISVMYKNIKPILAHSSHIFDRKPDTINRNYFIITENEKVGLIDYNNKWVLNYDVGIQEIQSIYRPLNSEKVFIIAKKQDKVGAIDQSGKTVIPFEYDYAEADFTMFEHFKFGHYRFYKGKKRFLVDWDKGKLVKE